jgi:hypothetical protein
MVKMFSGEKLRRRMAPGFLPYANLMIDFFLPRSKVEVTKPIRDKHYNKYLVLSQHLEGCLDIGKSHGWWQITPIYCVAAYNYRRPQFVLRRDTQLDDLSYLAISLLSEEIPRTYTACYCNSHV